MYKLLLLNKMDYIEEKYVHRTYQKIYKHFDNSRTYLWKGVKTFLDELKPYSTIIEIGSGNGKNLLRRPDCINIALDLCSNFTQITNKKGVESITANNLSIPIRTNACDAVLSIAVIHHLSTKQRRLDCINELIRILKPGGKLLIQVWALDQPKTSRRKFTEQDNYVEFNSPDKSIKELRYYHVFKENELDKLVSTCTNIKIIKSYWEIGNWVMVIQKT